MINRFMLYAVLLLACIGASCNAQHIKEKNYTDFAIKGNRLLALSSSGHINIFDINTGDNIDTNIRADTTIIAFNLNKKGAITVVEANGKVAVFSDNERTFTPLFVAKGKVYNITSDSHSKPYLVTDSGIYDVVNKKTYLPDSSFRLNAVIFGWRKPSVVFMDKDDNIWIGSGHGEWGGGLYVFNTKAGKFIKPALNEAWLLPVKSIFEDDSTVYVSGGLQHFEMFGNIIKFNNYSCRMLFSSKPHSETRAADIQEMINRKYKGPAIIEESIDGEYIGPATYRKENNSIYFYSQHGLFKGDKDDDLSKIDNWTKIASPKLHWRDGQPDAVGSPMNVLKMAFAPNGKLFILTQNDGIGVYDGKAFTLLN